MNTAYKRVILAGILTAFTAAATAAGAEAAYGAAGARAVASPTVEQMLVFAIQDEYLAGAEYDLIMSKAGSVRPFSNIRQAEEQHVAWLAALMRANGYAVPADTGAAHAVLPADLKGSFEAGVQAEVDNIAMYDAFLKRELPADVRSLFERLRAASENHLAAFRQNLARAR
jgi:hypothetical protein